MMGQNPVADFSADVTSGCAPLNVNFKDLSTGSPIAWNWDFGGRLDTRQNPTNISFTPGTYTITLTVRNANGVSSVTKNNFIVSNPSPTADFIADRTITCLPASIQFTDKSVANAGTIVKWDWGFDDLPPSSAQNPSHTYTKTGYYTIYLGVTSSTGCTASITKGRYIRILNGVKANFDYTGPTTCQAPFSITYKNLTSGPGALTYAWDLGNGTTSTAAAPPPGVYATAGTYTVKLKAQSDYGCSDSIQKNIPVNGISTTFSSPATVCLGSAATFQSTSTPTPVKVLWKFSDGTTSTLPTTSKTFAAAGSYTVTLYSTFASCSDSATKTIIVADKPTVGFTADKNSGCKPPLAVAFQNTSPDFASSAWDFGDGGTSTSANPSHTYNSTGNFNVTLSITDSKGCKNSATAASYINIFGPNVQLVNIPIGLCVGQSFSPSSNIGSVDGVAGYLWDFGDGTTSTSANPSHSYASTGIKTIKLTITTNGGCTASQTGSIQVGTPPVVDFTADTTTACRSGFVSFTNLSTPINSAPVSWDFGDGTTSTAFTPPPHKFGDSGRYTIKLKVTNNGCSDSLIKMNYIHILPPAAFFGFRPDCTVKTNVAFLDSTANGNPPYGPLTYKWSFGDPANTTSTIQNPTFNYPAIATYNVQLIATNNVCSDTIVMPVRLYNAKAVFTLDKTSYCRNDRVTLFSSNDLSFVKTFTWVLDGIATPTDQASHFVSFGTTGTHSAQLITTDIYGCNDTSAVQTFNVTGPTALFTIANHGGCDNSTITFNDMSTTVSGNILTKWIFDFGDGTAPQTFTAPPFTHKYANTGVYDVKLTVFDNTTTNCSDTYSLTGSAGAVITRPIPNFGAAMTTFCPNTALQFTDSSFGSQLTYAWSFGDGGTGNTQNPTHLYTGKDSVYTVKLIVTDSVGCADSLVRNNYIAIRSPQTTFNAKDTITLCPPLETKFFYTGKNSQSVLWDFGDGSTPSSLDATNHFYSNFGKYTTTLYAYGFGGCVDSAKININVTNPYFNTTVTFDPKSACNELLVNFNVVSHPFGTTFTFDFGDGYWDTTQNLSFQHFYSSPIFTEPAIFLKDSTGCEAYFGGFGLIDIRGAVPIYGVDKKLFCDSGTVSFIDYSQEGRDPITSKSWDFGDGVTNGTGGNISHSYTQPGLYAPGLTVNTASGCSKTFTDTVRVLATPTPVIGSADGVCSDLFINFAGSLLVPPDTAIQWKWDLGNGQTSTQQNVSVHYADTGLYRITLQAANSLGCKRDTSKNITVFPLPSITVSGDTTLIAGAGGTTMPLTYSANASTFAWTPPGTLSCTDCGNPFANPKFTTTYKVVVTDANGCISSRDVTLLVLCNNKNFFIPNTFSPNNDGANDRFYPRGTGLDRIQALRIFNRWGEAVFEKRNFPANDAASGWDGTYKGKTAPTDTYVYMIDIICENATIITYKGNITLIR